MRVVDVVGELGVVRVRDADPCAEEGVEEALVAATINGDVPAVAGQTTTMLAARQAGGDIVMFAGTSTQYGASVSATKKWVDAHKITPQMTYKEKLNFIKGASVGITSPGGGADQIFRYIAAEAGVNHNGSAELACRLVNVAADAGADAGTDAGAVARGSWLVLSGGEAPRLMASATPTMETASSRLLQILATWPMPVAPQCTMFWPMPCSTGCSCANSSGVAPTMKVSVPAAAPPVPPETGASASGLPWAAASLARRCTVAGAMLGALIVGLLDAYGRWLVPEMSYFVLFGPMAVLLLFRPRGLFGSAQMH